MRPALNRRDFLRMLSVGLGLSAISIPVIGGRPLRAYAAVDLDGTGDQVTFGDVAAFDDPSSLSYCFWLYHSVTLGDGGNHCLLGKGNNFYSYVASANANGLAAGVSGVSERRTTAAQVHPNHRWNHIGYIYDDVALQILANGVSEALTGTEPNFPDQTTQTLDLGSGDALTRPAALFALFKAWGAVLTPAEMQAEMHSYRPQRVRDLLLWAPGEDSNRMTDYSGNNRHGTFEADARLGAINAPVTPGD